MTASSNGCTPLFLNADLPSPLDIAAIIGHDPERPEKEIVCKTDWDSNLAALAHKIANDPFAGTLTYVRVYSGVLKTGDQVYNPREKKKERHRSFS